MKQPDETLGRRSRRRPSSADVSHAVFDRTRPYRHLRNPFAPMKVFSDDQVAAIHDAALVMLETQGMKVLSADARVRYRNAGGESRRHRANRAPGPRARRRIARRARRATSRCTPSTLSGTCRCRARRRIRGDLGAAEHHGHGARTARRYVRGFLQPDEAVPELRGHPRARRGDRAAGHSGAHPPSGSDPRAAHADATRSRSFFRAATARSPTISSSSASRTASRRRNSARGLTPTPSSTPIRRCSSTSRWRTASSISPRPARCSSSRRSLSPGPWRR